MNREINLEGFNDVEFRDGLTVAEAIDILFSHDAGDVYIEAPAPNADTDEDSGDEGETTLDNLTGRQLAAPAEIVLPGNIRIGGMSDESDVPDVVDVPLSNKESRAEKWAVKFINDEKKYKRKGKVGKKSRDWYVNCDFEENRSLPFPTPNFDKYKNLTIMETFELFMDDAIIELLVTEIQNYAHFKNLPNPSIDTSDIKCFLAILFLSGYVPLPSKRHYWDQGNDLKNLAVSNAMRRDKFLQICKFMHCSDNNKLDPTDRAGKVRPLMHKIKENCLKNFIPQRDLSYDESMVRYFGRHCCKQFIRGKPIRFGYKMWCLNTHDSYLINFDFYQGKNPRGNTNIEAAVNKVSAPLVQMIEEFKEKDLNYRFYTDNLFTSRNLLLCLRHFGYMGIGTLRENRVPKDCPLIAKKKFLKNKRGDYQTAINKKDGLLYCRWKDNNVVTTLSADVGAAGGKFVKRYSQAEKKHVQVYQPKVINLYNKNMGGTDQMDQNISCYRINIHGKKWWWPIFTWLLDVARVNSYYIFSKNHSISQLQYTRELVNTYLTLYGNERKAFGRPAKSLQSSDSRVSDEIRFNGRHFIIYTEGKRRRRCAGIKCKSSGITMCDKCNVGLCLSCFKPFHTQK